MASNAIQLGHRVRDKITGFEGIVISLASHITGCDRVGVRPIESGRRDSRGSEEWFYRDQLATVDTETEFREYAAQSVTKTDFSLGDVVVDEITGFEGVVTTITVKLYNVPRIGVQARDTTATTEKGEKEWFDANRLEHDGNAIEKADEYQTADKPTAAGCSDESGYKKQDSG